MSSTKDSAKPAQIKKTPVQPFRAQSKFGGAGSGTFVTKSQYKPAPVRITQHKG